MSIRNSDKYQDKINSLIELSNSYALLSRRELGNVIFMFKNDYEELYDLYHFAHTIPMVSIKMDHMMLMDIMLLPCLVKSPQVHYINPVVRESLPGLVKTGNFRMKTEAWNGDPLYDVVIDGDTYKIPTSEVNRLKTSYPTPIVMDIHDDVTGLIDDFKQCFNYSIDPVIASMIVRYSREFGTIMQIEFNETYEQCANMKNRTLKQINLMDGNDCDIIRCTFDCAMSMAKDK